METKKILRGLSTVNFYAANHSDAVKWYTDFLETRPYFNVSGYAEFRMGDYHSFDITIDIAKSIGKWDTE